MDQLLPDDLTQILRLSLKSTGTLVGILESNHEDQQDGLDPGHIRRLIEEILWHRKFILTYYVVIGFVVAISCSLTGYETLRRRHKKRRLDKTEDTFHITRPSASSSSSSTLRGTISPAQKVNTEATPLLVPDATFVRPRPSTYDRCKAFLVYQPRPIPALTSRLNVLPDNATSIMIVLFAALNLFYLLYRTPLELEWVFIIADRAGLLFVANLPVLYVLAAKTNQPIKFLTGWSYEGLNMFHRRLGEWMIITSVIHTIGMLMVWWTILRALGYTLLIYLTSPTVYLGIVTILSYFVIYRTSTGWFRQLYYEAFLGLHIFFQVAALVFLYFHYPTAQPYVLATLLIWSFDRLLWRCTLSARRFIATLEVAPDQETVLIRCEVDLQRRILGIRAGLHHGWSPGQHLFLTVPSMGFKHRFQTHPFTIASPAPPRNTDVKSWPLQLVIRSIDGFSLDLLNYARHHQHCEVILEGPHGGMEALEAAHHAGRVCFVAGGSGIAVTYPLAWDHQVEQHNQHDALVDLRTTYRAGSKYTPNVLDSEYLLDKGKFAHFWVRQNPKHEKWISIVPKAKSMYSASAKNLDNKRQGADDSLEAITSIITHTFDTRKPGPDGGRPDMKGELWDWVTSTTISNSSSSTTLDAEAALPIRETRQASASSSMSMRHQRVSATFKDRQNEKISIVVSGPDGLVRDIRNVVAELVKEGWNIEVWVEKFGW